MGDSKRMKYVIGLLEMMRSAQVQIYGVSGWIML